MALIQVEMNQVNGGGTSDVIVPNAIANLGDNTSSGLITAASDDTLQVGTAENNTNPVLSKRINIVSTELVADANSWVYADFLQDINIGEIIEVEYTTRFTSELSGQRYSSKFIKLRVNGTFEGNIPGHPELIVQPVNIIDYLTIADGSSGGVNGDLVGFQGVKFVLIKNTNTQTIQKIGIYQNGVRFTSLLAPNNQGNVTSVVTSSVNNSLLIIKAVYKIVE